MSERPFLRGLAERRGILPSYRDQSGREERVTSDATREALLAAMGLDASTETAARGALDAADEATRERALEPVRVWREQALSFPTTLVRVPRALDAPVSYELRLELEDGGVATSVGSLARNDGAPLALPLPRRPAPGHHRLRLRLRGSSAERTAEQRFVVAPATALRSAEALGDRRTFGLVANLYAVRSARGEGIGDLGDLRALLSACGAAGGDFVGVNPLHALRNEGLGVSPYSPISRLHRSELYLELEAVPELEAEPSLRARLADPALREAAARLRAGAHVDYASVRRLKREILGGLHRAFVERDRGRDTARGRAYARHLSAQGASLEDFATFVALEAWLAETRGLPPGWHGWPAEYRDKRSPEVARFRAEHAEAIDLERWLQFELARQLEGCAEAARRAHLGLGVYQDLALGSAPDGADTWAFRELFAFGANVGAPPDDYSLTGQDWGFPPLDPERLREDGYGYWIALLRAALASAGAVRIDHALGLRRLFWIPAGRSGAEGAYVLQPAEELLGILALESRRHGALVVGEDLGTVPPEVAQLLASFGVLSSRVLYFEREGTAFRPAAAYSARALVTANTHDLAPIAGWLEGRDLALRREAGQLDTQEALAAAQERRAADRAALLALLRAEGLLPAEGPEPEAAAWIEAIHAMLCRTPAPVVGISLDDVAAEREPVNLPGLALDRYPSWQRRMAKPLAALLREIAGGIPGTAERRRRA